MSGCIYPLIFEPELRHYIWGGRNLADLFGRKLPPGRTAESWEISGHPSSPTRVAAGYWKGKTLPEVMRHLGTKLVGSHSQDMLQRGRFPLLVKLLDAHDNLSVQVHPDDDYAREHENDLGKPELWCVLYAEPGAELIYGLKRGVDRRRFVEGLHNGSVQELLHHLPVKEGDVVSVPTGTLHAIMSGIVVAEVQRNSDATYRVYDWDRVDDEGNPRELHVDDALNVIDWNQVEPGKASPVILRDEPGLKQSLMVSCPQFVLESLDIEAGHSFAGTCDGSTFEIWGCISGEAEIRSAAEPVALPAVRFALLPAALGDYTIVAKEKSRLMRIYVDGH